MQENILGTEKIGKLLIKFAIPGIIGMLVNALYNIVDQIFIGRGVGFLGNGATNVIFPLVVFALAISLLFGDGAASYMSLHLIGWTGWIASQSRRLFKSLLQHHS